MNRAVGELSDRGVVRDHDDRLVQLAPKIEHRIKNAPAGLSIEVAGGFVGKQDRRMVDQRAGNGDPLPFPAGERGGFVFDAVRQPKRLKQLLGGLTQFVSSSAETQSAMTDHGAKQNILKNAQLGQQMIELKNKTYRLVSIAVEFALRSAGQWFAFKEHANVLLVRSIGPVQASQYM